MIATANPIPSSAAASPHAATSPSLELLEARRARDDLTTLLRHEQVAMADFLVALADFDRRRGWEVLGHSSLFAFLHVELKLPNPSAFWRMSAARLLQRFPDLAAPLRDGRLCCTATAELAKVLTEQNRAEVLPRFFGLSSREAQEVVAELQPRQAPATRTVVTAPARVAAAPALASSATSLAFGDATLATAEADAPGMHPNVVPPSQLRAPEVAFGGGVRAATLRDDVEPLTADLRRLHITVDAQFLRMLATARDGLSHTIPGASMEQVLKAALELLLDKHARARGLVKRPRTVVATATPTVTKTATATKTATKTATETETETETETAIETATPTATPTPPTSAPGAASAATARAAAAATDLCAASAADSATATALGTAPVSAATSASASASASALASAPGTASSTVSVPVQITATPTAAPATEAPPLNFTPPLHRRGGARKHVPAAIVREVWQRDGGRCSWPLDSGGVCGSTHRPELDHVVPWARWGGETVADLRIVCSTHNRLAARLAFGARCVGRYAGRRKRGN